MKKIMTSQSKEELKESVRSIQQKAKGKGGYKSRYLALNLMVDYLEPYSYLEENPETMSEIIDSTLDTQ